MFIGLRDEYSSVVEFLSNKTEELGSAPSPDNKEIYSYKFVNLKR